MRGILKHVDRIGDMLPDLDRYTGRERALMSACYPMAVKNYDLARRLYTLHEDPSLQNTTDVACIANALDARGGPRSLVDYYRTAVLVVQALQRLRARAESWGSYVNKPI